MLNTLLCSTVQWDRRNGVDSYPFSHNVTHGWQSCPKCGEVVMVMEIACDYYPSREECKCGAVVQTLGVEDVGRFSGLENIIREAEGLCPVQIGEIPENASELVRGEFAAMAAHGY